MKDKSPSIFKSYFSDSPFKDRYLDGSKDAVDVVIPLIHTNEVWRSNLLSIYREIPVHRLLIGDGGCIDDSIKIAREFPRVTVYNHRNISTLGFSIRKLIEKVETKWFIYLHSDVYIPPQWFGEMKKNQNKYDWFECRQHLTYLVDYPLDYSNYYRPLSGSQMGRREAFKDILPEIDDDYVYRNEDVVYANLIRSKGFRYGRADNIFHYHQLMAKKSNRKRIITNIEMNVEKDTNETRKEYIMEAQSIIKYLKPDEKIIALMKPHFTYLMRDKGWNSNEFEKWVTRTNPLWSSIVSKIILRQKIILFCKKIVTSILRAK